jgi:isoamylase
LGVPMIVMGDEVRRTQHGNNNAYCQDNEISWFDWSLIGKHAALHRFVQMLIERRLQRGLSAEPQRLSLNELIDRANKAWHGVKLNQPDWGDDSHCIALGAELKAERIMFHLILNAHWEPHDFELPTTDSNGTALAEPWRCWIDTALEQPNDIVDWENGPMISEQSYAVQPRSVVVLLANLRNGA